MNRLFNGVVNIVKNNKVFDKTIKTFTSSKKKKRYTPYEKSDLHIKNNNDATTFDLLETDNDTNSNNNNTTNNNTYLDTNIFKNNTTSHKRKWVDDNIVKNIDIETKKFKKDTIPKRIRELVWTTYNGECFAKKCFVSWCDNEINVFNFQVGHDIPESKGGTLDISNLKPICGSCNLSMGNKFTITDWSKLIKPLKIKR